MLQTAETVAKRYNIAREPQDEYGVQSQQRAAAAQAAGKFNDEIVPITVTAGVADKATGRLLTKQVTLAPTRASAPTPRYEGVAKITPGCAGRRDRGRQRQPVLRRCRRRAW